MSNPGPGASTDHPNATTRAYQTHGLPATLPADVRGAWEAHLAGTAVPLRLLPTNGDRCTAQTHSLTGCGFWLLIDGSCPNVSSHTDADDADEDVDDDADEEIEPALAEIGQMSLHLPTGHAAIRGMTPGDDATTPEIGQKSWDRLPVAMGGSMLLFEGLDPTRTFTTTGPVVDLRHEPPAFDNYGFNWAGRSTSDVAARAAEYGWRVITRRQAAELLARRGYVIPPRRGPRAKFHSVLWEDQIDELTWYVPESSDGFRYVYMRSAFVVRDTGGRPPAAMAEDITGDAGENPFGFDAVLAQAAARLAQLVPGDAARSA